MTNYREICLNSSSEIMRLAIIDLGTNTFHLLIIEKSGERIETLYKDQIPAKIGKAGINRGIIVPEAIERAVAVLKIFRQKIDEFEVDLAGVHAIGTSAIRNAQNKGAFCEVVKEKTGILIQVISGEREAELIYEGVRQALDLGHETSLIMDIGGGSVEFIIANSKRIFWKQSFEIGGQRLMEKFMTTDPITALSIRRLCHYFDESLLHLTNAIHQYAPTVLVGSSGSFDTLVDMDFMHKFGHLPDTTQTSFEYEITEFWRAYQLLTTLNRAERMKLGGMIDLRVDMIVVGVVLIEYIIKTFKIQQIRCSTYALKEGILRSICSQIDKVDS